MKLSLAITTHNEFTEIQQLFPILLHWLRTSPYGADSELVVVDDYSDPETSLLLSFWAEQSEQVSVHKRELKRNFAEQKNYLTLQCKGEWILQLDADEMVSPEQLDFYWDVVSLNSDIDAYWLPRLNTVTGLTLNHVKKWHWVITSFDELWRTDSLAHISVDSLNLLEQFGLIINQTETEVSYRYPVVNWPDPQMRLYRNDPKIRWTRPVHEQLVGYDKYSIIPNEREFAINHHKRIEKQEKQNAFYSTLQGE